MRVGDVVKIVDDITVLNEHGVIIEIVRPMSSWSSKDVDCDHVFARVMISYGAETRIVLFNLSCLEIVA